MWFIKQANKLPDPGPERGAQLGADVWNSTSHPLIDQFCEAVPFLRLQVVTPTGYNGHALVIGSNDEFTRLSCTAWPKHGGGAYVVDTAVVIAAIDAGEPVVLA